MRKPVMFSPIQRFADDLANHQALLTEEALVELESRKWDDGDDPSGGSAVREPRNPRPGGSPMMATV